MFNLYLACSTSSRNTCILFNDWDWDAHPVNILISYAYADNIHRFFDEIKPRPRPRNVMIDSGAFSVRMSGHAINLDEYIRFIQDYREQYGITGVVALDVIGDAQAGLDNAQRMLDAGLDVIPVHHIGEDISFLEQYCEQWQYVGLASRSSGVRDLKMAHWYYRSCFKACWPHRFHSFGWTAEKMLTEYPFYSADSSSFVLTALKYGSFAAFGRQSLPGVRGDTAVLAAKGDIYKALELERRVRARWKGI